ncbi:MAG: galactokinase [Pseudomonadota bacterium]
MDNLQDIVQSSAPCRLDCGGTLDISTFRLGLSHLSLCTFNIALNMRTRVRLLPYRKDMVRISSCGVGAEEYPAGKAPYSSRLGLMFAVASYFNANGVDIEIESESPPRSGLGGSSTAAVALVAAFVKARAQMGKKPFSKEEIVILAYQIEDGLLPVPCGLQDQLAAAFGGVNAWHWPSSPAEPLFKKVELLPSDHYTRLEERMLLAYCGVTHESYDINGRWVRGFMEGDTREAWEEIARSARQFVDCIARQDWKGAVQAMNQEVEIRIGLTPEVFVDIGKNLRKDALKIGCAARFVGAGGGGCIWALGEKRI